MKTAAKKRADEEQQKAERRKATEEVPAQEDCSAAGLERSEQEAAPVKLPVTKDRWPNAIGAPPKAAAHLVQKDQVSIRNAISRLASMVVNNRLMYLSFSLDKYTF